MPKTAITYYGGKLNMLKEILPRIPNHRIYTEAFFGGGAVFFAKQSVESETINDTNALVVNFYEVLKTDFVNLKKKIESTLFSRSSYIVANTIYRMPHLFDRLQQAWAFYISTNMGFACKAGGSWGYDKYGKRVKALRNKKLIFNTDLVDRLEHAQIENKDAISVIEARDTLDSFHYVDPPYINSNQGSYGGYTEEDYTKLLSCLENVKGKFLLSSYPSDILSEFIKKNNWQSIHFEKPLSAKKSTNGKQRDRKVEVLTANYPLHIEHTS